MLFRRNSSLTTCRILELRSIGEPPRWAGLPDRLKVKICVVFAVLRAWFRSLHGQEWLCYQRTWLIRSGGLCAV